MKKILVLRTFDIEEKIQPLLNEGWEVSNMISENVSGSEPNFTAGGHIVIYLIKKENK